MKQIALLLFYLIVILLGAQTFTNGIEWLGRRLKLGDGAVGSVLAAVGTALPETMIPIIAFAGGSSQGFEDVGIGAILGAPFMLATLAFFLSGFAVLLFRRSNEPLELDILIVRRDIQFFLFVYFLAVVTSFITARQIKNFISLILIMCYIWYLVQTIRLSYGQSEHRDLAPLYLAKGVLQPATTVILGQIFLALLAIIWGANGFVYSVQAVAEKVGLPVIILSLIITPIATELPEKFNSIIWLSQRKDTLAIGNITGAMVFQSSLIPALGIVFTPWHLNFSALWSAMLALGAALIIYLSMIKNGKVYPTTLLWGGVFYLSFILSIFNSNGG